MTGEDENSIAEYGDLATDPAKAAFHAISALKNIFGVHVTLQENTFSRCLKAGNCI